MTLSHLRPAGQASRAPASIARVELLADDLLPSSLIRLPSPKVRENPDFQLWRGKHFGEDDTAYIRRGALRRGAIDTARAEPQTSGMR
jgi:hypothetical protein